MDRVATASPQHEELRRLIAKQLYKTLPTTRILKTLSWRERWAALNRWRWAEFRSGVGYREYVQYDISGLAAVVGG